jgi:glycosyltransferase involved in cell wall biosynthesis
LYLASIFKLFITTYRFKPDIVHAHYASSYGLIGSLIYSKKLIVSVWGNDILTFPKISFLHKVLTKFVLYRADEILATSRVLQNEVSLYSSKQAIITPFGIDIEAFKNFNLPKSKDRITIGIIKSLEYHYGIEYLIQSFKIVIDNHRTKNIFLAIVGGGALESKLKDLVKALDLNHLVTFYGQIPYEEVPNYHNLFDIEVYLSVEESFGVSVLEASACEIPVIVSDIGGLTEVVENGKTGFIVSSESIQEAADAIHVLITDEGLRSQLGKNGRKRVEKFYSWDNCVGQMVSIYNSLLK